LRPRKTRTRRRSRLVAAQVADPLARIRDARRSLKAAAARPQPRRFHVRPLAVALLLAGGCGGGEENAPPPRPTIQRAVADQLASTSNAIADALDQGDVCTAAGLADDLNAQVIDAINARQIPPALQEDLQARANELVNAVNCPPPPEEDEEEDEEGEGKRGKGKGKDKKQETIELPVEPPTVTDGDG
jgi:hypothetical protein